MVKKFYFLFLALLCIAGTSKGQFNDSYSYDFRDGTIIGNGQSDDGKLVLGGTYSHHSASYGLNMKVDGTIDITVDGSSTIRFLGSAYSGLNLVGTVAENGDLGTQFTKVENDLSDTYDFVYSGTSKTLNFTTTSGSGDDLYLPLIDVIPAQNGGDSSLTAPEKNIVYYFDLRDESIIPSTAPGNAVIEKGLFKIEAGCCNAYAYHGTQHGIYFKDGNKITLQVAGNSYIRLGGDQYSGGTVSVSGNTGSFDLVSQSHQTGSTYADNAPVWVEFMYVGDAGTVEIISSGSTNYLPFIEVVPIPFEVSLNEYVQKSGTINVNDIDINLASGATANDPTKLTVSAGQVLSALTNEASIRIDLGGKPLSSYTPTFSGDIAGVDVNGDTLKVTYSGETTLPESFNIIVADESLSATAEAGKTYSYNFADGSVLPQNTTIKYTDFYTSDGIVNIKSNDGDEFWYHDASHGVVCYDKNSYEITVAGDAIITFVTCTYSDASSIFTFTDEEGKELGTIAANNNGGADAFAVSFAYTGSAGVVRATLSSEGAVYIHGMTIENAAEIEPSEGLIDVWDFGAEQLDTTRYKNNLDVGIINSWYDESITAGSSGNVLPGSFSAGALSWVGGGNDRLRTSNTNITRYDENIGSEGDYTGRLYVNSAGATGRYLSLALSEDDEVKLMMLTQNGSGKINFEYVADPDAQTDVADVFAELSEVNFVAKQAGTFHIYDTQDKPSYYRIYRSDASYISVTGKIDTTQAAGIPGDYEILFTNKAGKSWAATIKDTAYSVSLPSGYSYDLSLANANGYIVSSDTEFSVSDSTSSLDVSLSKVKLNLVEGAITGLDENITNLELVFTPDTASHKIFMPEAVLIADSATYSVELESNCFYIVSAKGVNDYCIPKDTIYVENADKTFDIAFEAKPVYKVTINTSGLTETQLDGLSLVFSNLNEETYNYAFSSVDSVFLRDGVYTVDCNGLDNYPLELGKTSNLNVSGSETTKDLVFNRVVNWAFNDQVITNGDPAYKGLLFSGTVYNEIAKGHLSAKPEATIQVPVKTGEKVVVSYYYSADFSIDGGDSISTSSGSTSKIESTEYKYPGTEDGTVTLTVGSGASTTYITNIAVKNIIEYRATITVGAGKEYQTINAALEAVRNMDRLANERVTVMIDPGNYEEMLVIDIPNVSFRNAAVSPDIALKNQGVDISANAVRITSYYGHGYNYYSMNDDQKWNAEILRVNKENGYLSYENKGSGTTNDSYWNATVVISAVGFEAEHIIFENSFNQYISKKESEDVVEMWVSGSKGERPTDYGNTAVQDRSFVERAAAIALTGSADKVILNRCRVVGRQDSFYGSSPARVVVYKGAVMGAVDYIFGAMTGVFYKTDLIMNTSDVSSDAAYITAAQHSTGRGYLMYECNVTSTEPGVETASVYRAKPGYFGRPWQANTSEVVFYNTSIETSDYPGSEGRSLITPIGWMNSLGGESVYMYEYGTIEESNEDNSSARAAWSTILSEPKLAGGTDITTFNFTKGSDDWDPISALIQGDKETGIDLQSENETGIIVYGGFKKLHISNVSVPTLVKVFNLNGVLLQVHELNSDTTFPAKSGVCIVQVINPKGIEASKVLVR